MIVLLTTKLVKLICYDVKTYSVSAGLVSPRSFITLIFINSRLFVLFPFPVVWDSSCEKFSSPSSLGNGSSSNGPPLRKKEKRNFSNWLS